MPYNHKLMKIRIVVKMHITSTDTQYVGILISVFFTELDVNIIQEQLSCVFILVNPDNLAVFAFLQKVSSHFSERLHSRPGLCS